MKRPDPDPFAILGLAPDASPEHIKRGYLALVKRWHPDRFANDPEQLKLAEEKMRAINVAYQALQGGPKLVEFFQHGSTAPDYDSAAAALKSERSAYAYGERPSGFAFWHGHTSWSSWVGTAALVGIAVSSLWFAAVTLSDHYGPPFAADFIRHEAKLQSVFANTRRAAEQGEVWAMVNLGWFHFTGRGVRVNKGEAAHWFAQAAHAGDAGAQFQIGWMLAHGDGVPPSLAEALRWWELAAVQGHRDARQQRDELQRHLNAPPNPAAPQRSPAPAPRR